MSKIIELDTLTINKIAAGEVIERPSAVVKELVENAIDAKANAITIEIKEGGISFIRITDNGSGIAYDDIDLAFKRHSTSKIKSVEDLMTITSLGFRGEALSSIASVSQVELLTKVSDSMLGTRYVIEGGKKISCEEIGCPDGTTFIVRNLFYNTPVRRKFLKTPATEAGYVSAVVEKMSIAHPEIAFKFIVNGQLKIHTTGNSNIKDIIYTLYGRDIAANLLPIDNKSGNVSVKGFIGKPVISRGNRNMEIYYINGRAIKSVVIAKAIEEAFKAYTMVHRYPFVALHVNMDPSYIDVNVHPTKMEVRFSNSDELYYFLYNTLKDALCGKNLIQSVKPDNKEIKPASTLGKPVIQKNVLPAPEPFEQKRLNTPTMAAQTALPPRVTTQVTSTQPITTQPITTQSVTKKSTVQPSLVEDAKTSYTVTNNLTTTSSVSSVSDSDTVSKTPLTISQSELTATKESKSVQTSLFDSEEFIKNNKNTNFTIVGQIFNTYWIVECNNNMYMIDQHAAHEKVLFEKTMASIRQRTPQSQIVSPPIILSLTLNQEEVLKKHSEDLKKLGYEIEHFGGREYNVSAIPSNLPGIADASLLIEMLDDLYHNDAKDSSDLILEKVASLSCKAAVKGNNRLSKEEAASLIDELMQLDNPFNCPHGRPTIISMSKSDIERKFKRIV